MEEEFDYKKIKLDCRYYRGEKPCKFKRLCDNCPHYSPQGFRILIIKLGAMGDVLRTTPILTGLKRIYPHSHITWLVEETSSDLLKNNPFIDVLLTNNYATFLRLMVEKFDLMLNFDKDYSAISLAEIVQAKEKRGFGMTANGSLKVLNEKSEYALFLGISDDLKYRINAKTYQQIIFEQAEIPYQNDDYILILNSEEIASSIKFREKYKISKDDKLIGINTGAGAVFATKRWGVERTAELIKLINKEKFGKAVLLGGVIEKERNNEIMQKAGVEIINPGCDNSLREFISIVNACDAIVSTDSLSMHLGLALKKKVVALFGSTCPQEVEMYGRGIKVVASRDCCPCYLKNCPFEITCMDEIKAETVFEALKSLF